ncbi:hypothetical protein R5R35_008431 [Gryllus longicercus]|uniref:Palmitoyltransferase n=1 Tax=Gryllus longicercus TaxID=2509291 RepID=A0AAN9VY87_9ORTH
MKIRRRFFPRAPISMGAFVFIWCVIPLVYWFELYVVLPALYEVWSLHYWMHFIIGHILMINVLGSYLGLVLIDNSVNRHLNIKDIQPNWRHCDKCNIHVPPRSWHCAECDLCMLKRDHHCFFTGYCVGHYNHRLFLMFLFYLMIACVYATFYNCCFLGRQMEFSKLLLKTAFSLPMLIFHRQLDITVFYVFIFQIIIAGFIFVVILFTYHALLVACGRVGYEKNQNISKYDMGMKQNFINVFGERWYISWLSPFISSTLPSNGFCWEVDQTCTKKN